MAVDMLEKPLEEQAEVTLASSVREASELTGIKEDTIRDQLRDGRRTGTKGKDGWMDIIIYPDELLGQTQDRDELSGDEEAAAPPDATDAVMELHQRIMELSARLSAVEDERNYLRQLVASEQQIRLMVAQAQQPAALPAPEPPRDTPQAAEPVSPTVERQNGPHRAKSTGIARRIAAFFWD